MPKRPPWQMTAVRALLEGLDTWQRSIWLLEFWKILATAFYGDLHTKICHNWVCVLEQLLIIVIVLFLSNFPKKGFDWDLVVGAR